MVSSEGPTRRQRSPEDELERAMADYLAVSRGSHLYADAEAHAAAEQKAWERMMTLRDRADAAATV